MNTDYTFNFLLEKAIFCLKKIILNIYMKIFYVKELLLFLILIFIYLFMYFVSQSGMNLEFLAISSLLYEAYNNNNKL